MEKFLVIDGNSLAFRAYYALPFLASSNGQPTGAIFGFLNMLLKVMEDYQPTKMVIAFDFSKHTFRNDIFAAYKGTRKETPEDLRAQFPVLKNLLKLMKIRVVEKEGIEADDIIGTYAKSAPCETVILSGDRDLLQLIDDSTQVWLTHKGISEIHKMTTENIVADYGVAANQVVELKALMGDASDNIPGVQGVGPKTAANLINTFGTLEALYENLDHPIVSAKLKEKLLHDKDNAFLSKTLATIKVDCDIDTALENCTFSLPFNDEAVAMIQNLDMSTLLKRKTFFDVPQEEEPAPVLALKQFVINDNQTLEKVCACQPKELALAVEEELIFSFNDEYYYTVSNESTLFAQPPEFDTCLYALQKFLEDPNIPKVTCSYKALKRKLARFGIGIKGEVFDINLANYLLNNKPLDCSQVDRFFAQKTTLSKDLVKQQLDKIYYQMELPLEDVLFDMENAGFMVDKTVLVEYAKVLDAQLKTLSEKIINMAGEEFNINSPRQLAVVLFDKLSLPTENNPHRSTGVEILHDLMDFHPIVAEILHYRKVQKLKSTYVDAFLNILAQTNSNMIHTVFNQTLTSTGRLSSSDPNLQNLPVRDDEGKEFRKVFISRFENGVLVSADYNQIELRLLAHLSGDQTMIDAFNSGEDIHTATAMQIFKLKKEDVTPQIRRNAKAVNFGIVYGITNVGLAQNTGLSRSEAQEYIRKYFEIYPAVKEYLDENVQFAKKFGYVQTIFNRRRKIPELKADNHQARMFGERAAKNMPLQGSASDIIKFAMLKVDAAMKAQNLKSKLILQIHDELVVDAAPDEVDVVKNILKTAMESVISLSVNLPVDIECGKTYYDV